MNFADYAIRHKVIIYVFTLVLAIGGMYSFANLGRLEDPEFTIKSAKVITNYPGARPEEVEQEVTDVIETAIQELSQLDYIESVSMEGQSIVTPEILDNFDKTTLPQVWDELRRKVGDAQGELPPGAGPSLVIDDFGDVYGLYYGVYGEGFTDKELYDFTDIMRRELLLIDGVAKISLWGVQPEVVYVQISRARLAQLGISKKQIFETLGQTNLVIPAGNAKVGSEYISIWLTGSFENVAEIGDLIIRPAGSERLIRLSDVATIERGYQSPPTSIMKYNAQPAVAVGISIVPGRNVVEVGTAVKQRINELFEMAPQGLSYGVIYDQADVVTTSINGFMVSLMQALAIVIVVLLIFMGLRSGLLIGGMLLLTISGSFIFMLYQQINLERISLGALIIALGMLVDNAIVVTDGILVRMEAGKDKIKSAIDVVGQTTWPLLGATLVGILAFATISMSQDSTGEYTRSLFQVMMISLLLSWVVAVTVTPLFCVKFLKVNISESGEQRDPYKGLIYVIYKGFLVACIKCRWLTIGAMIAALAVAMVGFSKVDKSFFPDSTMPQFMVDYWRVQGTDIRDVNDDMKYIADYIMNLDGIESVSSFIGQGASRFTLMYEPEDTNPSYGQLIISVSDFKDIDSFFIPEVSAHLAEKFPEAEIQVKKFRMGTSQGFLIEGRFSGPDPDVLRELGEKAMTIMREDGGFKDIRTDWRQRVKLIVPQFSDNAARRAGVTRAQVSQAIDSTFNGVQVGLYREGKDLLPILSRSPEVERDDVASLYDVQVWSPVAQQTIPIRQVVTGFETIWEDPLRMRRDRKLTLTVQSNPTEGSATVALDRVKSQIEAIELPPGYEFVWGGEYEDSNDAQAAIYGNLPIVLLAMIILVIMLFNAIRQPLIIWLCVPLAIIGVAIGLLLTGQSFGFMALLGFLSLTGMLIKNAIVLIDQIDIDIASGKEPMTAIIDSSLSRLRPVTMAAITTVLGMIPLLFDMFFVSMAVTIMCGLAFATVLTLIVVPVLYAVFFNIKFTTNTSAAS